MSDIVKRFTWVSVYAIAMAFLEAVVVVYLRELLHAGELITNMGPYASMEAWREAATIIMLAAIGWLAGRHAVDRIAYGMFAFGLWDIWYYVWLKVLVDWPKTILDWDTLFLIPLPWRGPVLSPVMIAGLICVIAVLVVVRVNRQETPGITLLQVMLILCGVLLALYVFMESAIHLWIKGETDWSSIRNEVFNWPLFIIAFLLMAVPSLMAAWPARGKSLHHPSISD